MFEYIGIFVVAFICGMALAVFTKTMLRIFLFFTGFYVLVTAFLWYLGLISFNLTIGDIITMVQDHISSLNLGSRNVLEKLDIRYVIAIIGGVIGFITGWKKL